MELPLPPTTYSFKNSMQKTRFFIVLFSIVLFTAMLGLLQLKFVKPTPKDFYSFEVKDSRGRVISLEKYRGKACLVVNVASNCEYTDKNYIMLQELQRDLGSYHFTVLAFPCNQFGGLEPNTIKEIEYFAKSNYGVTFPIFNKIKILGSEVSPAFKFLIGRGRAWQLSTDDSHIWLPGVVQQLCHQGWTKEDLGALGVRRTWTSTSESRDSSKNQPKWNFWKYLINPEGKVVKFWTPEEPIESIKPDIAALIREIIVKKKEDL